jgi:predicted peroxiredoxin
MAVTCQALGAEVAVGLQGAGAGLAAKGAAETVSFPGCTPLKELMDVFFSYRGRMYTCGPPLSYRGIAGSSLIEGASIVDAGKFAELYLDADSVLVY